MKTYTKEELNVIIVEHIERRKAHGFLDMKTYTKEELDAIIAEHREWLYSYGERGSRAVLSGVDLSRVNLSRVKLSRANLYGANLFNADLSRADLSHADLSHADMSRAVLSRANLFRANLSGANLSGADLYVANLYGADLSGATLPGFNIPQEGDLTVWKNGREGLIKLLIPDGAKRTGSLVSRKCRAEYAKVLWTETGMPVRGKHNEATVYTPGEIVTPDEYDDDPRVECTNGIHFFLTREEAEDWS